MSDTRLVAIPQANVQQQKSNKGVCHLANAAGTTVGLGTTGYLLNKGIRQASNVCCDAIALSNGSKVIGTKTGPIFKFFERAGQKIFKDGTKLGNFVKRAVTGKLPSGGTMAHPEQIAAVMKKCKTVGAMALTATVAGLGLLASAIYKAGKINGQS